LNTGLIFVLCRLWRVGDPPPKVTPNFTWILPSSVKHKWNNLSFFVVVQNTSNISLFLRCSLCLPVSMVKESVCPYGSHLLKIIWLGVQRQWLWSWGWLLAVTYSSIPCSHKYLTLLGVKNEVDMHKNPHSIWPILNSRSLVVESSTFLQIKCPTDNSIKQNTIKMPHLC
jgi:hypothetical protein